LLLLLLLLLPAGTACAGIIAARHNTADQTPIGVMSSASLISCRMMNSKGGYASDAADCIYDMIQKNVTAVLSNSWAADATETYMEEAIVYACQNGEQQHLGSRSVHKTSTTVPAH
jgi:subtilisin family serine protease